MGREPGLLGTSHDVPYVMCSVCGFAKSNYT